MRGLGGCCWSEGSLASPLEAVHSSVPSVPTSRRDGLLGTQGTQTVPTPFWEGPPDPRRPPHLGSVTGSSEPKRQHPQWKWSVRLATGAKEVWVAGFCAPAAPSSCSCDFLPPPLTRLSRAAARLRLERETVQAVPSAALLGGLLPAARLPHLGSDACWALRPGMPWGEREEVNE